MKQILSWFNRISNIRYLKKYVFLLALNVLSLIAYLSFFTVQTEQKQILDTGPRESHPNWNKITQECLKKQAKQEQPLWKPEFRGRVNLHVFEDWCGGSIEQLKKNMLYPLFPHAQTTVNKLSVNPRWDNYGLRMFGYIHPASTGQYIFAISSDKNSEFWLSMNEKPHSLKLLAYIGKTGSEWSAPGEFGKHASQISRPVMLLKDVRYFFEVVFQHNQGTDHVEVAWRRNQMNTSFEVITSEYLSLYSNESSTEVEETVCIPQTAVSHEIQFENISKQPFPEVDMVRDDPRDSIYNIPLMNESILKNIFPECDYKPINIIEGQKLERFNGIYHVVYSALYPNDYTRQTHTAADEMCFYNKDKAFSDGGGFLQYIKMDKTIEEAVIQTNLFHGLWHLSTHLRHKKKKSDPDWQRVFSVNPVDFHSSQPIKVAQACQRAGNVIMNEKDVMHVVEAFMNQLHSTESTSDLVLKRVLNVERRIDGDVGGRYLLELELEDGQGQSRLLSKYFYVTKETNKERNQESLEQPVLCSQKGFSWNPAARVNVILPVKNQGRWVIHFIRQMEKIYRATQDENFHIIIIDYSSDDLDIEQALRNAELPSYNYKRLEGTFLKTTAIQTAIDLVEDANSILFTCDLHLHFPVSIIHNVRKHCIQGKMVFAPALMRLDCGATAQVPTGFWEIGGYGMIGIYKSDMDRVGGMNTKDFKDKWGGEDWELLDRILENHLEVERLNLRNFLHYFHSKRGMWNT